MSTCFLCYVFDVEINISVITTTMKTKIGLIIFLFTFSGVGLAQTWEYVNTLQNEWLTKVCTQGLDTVYIVGGDLIAKSTDRSRTWTKQHIATNVMLNDVIFVNHEIGFAVGSNGTIVKTIDAGVSWSVLNSGTTQNLNAIAADGANNVWVVGDNGTVLYSLNGGNTWLAKDLTVTSKLNDISYRNGNWIIVGDGYTFFKSSNNGVSWLTQELSILNSGNFPLDAFNFGAITQTSGSYSYITYGSMIYMNYNSTVYNFRPYRAFTSFAMLNDTVGYGFSAVMTTSGILSLLVEKFNYGVNDNSIHFFSNIVTPKGNIRLDFNHSDMIVVNDTIGYIVSGFCMFALKKDHTSNGTDGLNLIQNINKNLRLKCQNGELHIQSYEKEISDVEVYYSNGTKTNCMKRVGASECVISENNLALGLFIIRTIFHDGTSCTNKWIKK